MKSPRGDRKAGVTCVSLRNHTWTAEGQCWRWTWTGMGVGARAARSRGCISGIYVFCACRISKGLLPPTCSAPTLLSSESRFWDESAIKPIWGISMASLGTSQGPSLLCSPRFGGASDREALPSADQRQALTRKLSRKQIQIFKNTDIGEEGKERLGRRREKPLLSERILTG